MSNLQRRFEILLPRQFNDAQPVPDELVAETLWEFAQQFQAVSSETQIIRGLWQHAGLSYRDDLLRIFVDVPDIPENLQFFHAFKQVLKARFQQIDIRITTYLVEVF